MRAEDARRRGAPNQRFLSSGRACDAAARHDCASVNVSTLRHAVVVRSWLTPSALHQPPPPQDDAANVVQDPHDHEENQDADDIHRASGHAFGHRGILRMLSAPVLLTRRLLSEPPPQGYASDVVHDPEDPEDQQAADDIHHVSGTGDGHRGILHLLSAAGTRCSAALGPRRTVACWFPLVDGTVLWPDAEPCNCAANEPLPRYHADILALADEPSRDGRRSSSRRSRYFVAGDSSAVVRRDTPCGIVCFRNPSRARQACSIAPSSRCWPSHWP